MNDIKDYIVVVKNVLSNEVCDAILNEYTNSEEWLDTTVTVGIDESLGDSSAIVGVDKSKRSAQAILMSTDYMIAKNPIVRKKLDQLMFESASNAINRYKGKFKHAHIQQDTGYELLRYKTGEFYIQHTDSFLSNPRAVSCSFALNDDYEGGEFAFFDREISVKAPKGSALMFPSNFMYPHEILPVTKGIRYSIVTWFR